MEVNMSNHNNDVGDLSVSEKFGISPEKKIGLNETQELEHEVQNLQTLLTVSTERVSWLSLSNRSLIDRI